MASLFETRSSINPSSHHIIPQGAYSYNNLRCISSYWNHSHHYPTLFCSSIRIPAHLRSLRGPSGSDAVGRTACECSFLHYIGDEYRSFGRLLGCKLILRLLSYCLLLCLSVDNTSSLFLFSPGPARTAQILRMQGQSTGEDD